MLLLCFLLLATDGHYDAVIPEWVDGGMYAVRVGKLMDNSVHGCSPTFEIVPILL